jgi:hypothetical protein
MEGAEGMIYRGYKIEESPNPNWGWNVYKWSMCANRWIWLWAYESLYEAKVMIDAHLDTMEMEG